MSCGSKKSYFQRCNMEFFMNFLHYCKLLLFQTLNGNQNLVEIIGV